MTRPIIFIVNRLAVGGAERQVIDDVNELVARGESVVLITLRREGENSLSSECALTDEFRHQVVFEGLLDISAWRRLVRLLRSLRPRAVVSHLWFANTIARIAGFLAGVRCRITFEQNVYDTVKTRKQFFIDRALQPLSSRIVAVSDAVRDSLVRHGIAARRISVLVNAVRTKTFEEAAPSTIREDLGVPGGAFLFLTIGRLTAQKAQEVLITAFAAVPDAFLVIVGEGEERVKLEQLVHTLGLQGRVFLPGIRHDIPGLLKAVDCFVFPSRWEGVGIVMLEALAAGTPTIISDFPAARGIVENGVSGLVVPIDDSEALADAMKDMRADTALRTRLAAAGTDVAARYDIAHHADELLGMIEGAC